MKNYHLYVCLVALEFFSFSSSHSINQLNLKLFLNMYGQSPNIKPLLHEMILSGEIDTTKLDFSGLLIENINLSGLPLKGAIFKNSRLTNVNLEGCDLRNTNFEGSIFENVSLRGAILWDGFTFGYKLSELELLNLYSKLSNETDQFKANNFEQLSQACYKKTIILNQTVFNSLKLSLDGENLSNLNLKSINLQEASLAEANLQKTDLTGANMTLASLSESDLTGANLTNTILENACLNSSLLGNVWLSETLQLPESGDYEEIFALWYTSEGKDKRLYQKLINAKVNLFSPILNEYLKMILWSKLDLRNVNFWNSNLQDIDFSGLDLTGTEFVGANLQRCKFINTNLTRVEFEEANLKEANLIGANLTNTIFLDAELQGAQFSNTFKIPNYDRPNQLFECWVEAKGEDEKYYQKLFSSYFNIFDGVVNRRFLKADLRGKNFSGADLSDALLQGVDLTDTNLTNTNFSRAYLVDTKIGGARLSNKVVLPKNCNDQQLLELYRSLDVSRDKQAKKTLKEILFAKKIISNSSLTNSYTRQNIMMQNDNPCLQNSKGTNELFELWANAKGEEAENYQLLFKEGIDIFNNVSNQQFLKTDLKGKSFISANLIQAPLQNVNLTRADFTHANLSMANLEKSNLESTKLIGSNLTYANLRYANLRNADLTNAILKNIDLRGADLRGVILSNDFVIPKNCNDQQLLELYYSFIVHIDDKTLESLKAILEGKGLLFSSNVSDPFIDFTKDILYIHSPKEQYCQQLNASDRVYQKIEPKKEERKYQPLVLNGIVVSEHISNKQFSEMNLVGKDFQETNLVEAELQRLNLSCADFSKATLVKANLNESTLIKSIFSWSNLSNIKLEKVDAWGANFSHADLTDANLTGADLCFSHFERSNLTQAKLENTNLRESNLRGANFKNAHLKGSDLRNADLRDSNLIGADLSNTLLIGAKLGGACLSSTFAIPKEFNDQQILDLYCYSFPFIDKKIREYLCLILISKKMISGSETSLAVDLIGENIGENISPAFSIPFYSNIDQIVDFHAFYSAFLDDKARNKLETIIKTKREIKNEKFPLECLEVINDISFFKELKVEEEIPIILESMLKIEVNNPSLIIKETHTIEENQDETPVLKRLKLD